ncbi:DUF4148 domain-containing protein [Melaminivora suipulveris]|nr:DUF4148 domain-containing protein [Melaminivora suipulveris]
MMNKQNTFRTLLAAATMAGASLAAPAFAADAPSENWGATNLQAQPSSVSRAEVLADLALYRRAGLDAFDTGEASSLGNPGYARALAEYQRLRSGPEYLAEVRRYGGDARTVASERAQNPVR